MSPPLNLVNWTMAARAQDRQPSRILSFGNNLLVWGVSSGGGLGHVLRSLRDSTRLRRSILHVLRKGGG
ncbi:MAG TPA: hypothetical protein VI431_00725, partial [Candidatus Acidoferrum sp.]